MLKRDSRLSLSLLRSITSNNSRNQNSRSTISKNIINGPKSIDRELIGSSFSYSTRSKTSIYPNSIKTLKSFENSEKSFVGGLRVFKRTMVSEQTQGLNIEDDRKVKESFDGKKEDDHGRIIGPVETSIRKKILDKFNPRLLEISNDSHLHSHHSAMRSIGGGSGETHFTIIIKSEIFRGLNKIKRHRMVYDLLKEELERPGGIHALSIKAHSDDEKSC